MNQLVHSVNMNCAQASSRNIKKYRVAAGMTLPDLAKKAGISKGNLSKIEAKASNLSVATLCRLAKALNIPPSLLIS